MEIDLVESRKNPFDQEKQRELTRLKKTINNFANRTWLSFKAFLAEQAEAENETHSYYQVDDSEKLKIARKTNYISINKQIETKGNEKPYRNIFDAAYEFFFGEY